MLHESSETNSQLGTEGSLDVPNHSTYNKASTTDAKFTSATKHTMMMHIKKVHMKIKDVRKVQFYHGYSKTSSRTYKVRSRSNSGRVL